jgi:hypothetical protein
MAPRASASGTQFSTCAARRARESTRAAQGAASGTRHGAHDGSELRRRREREEVKLLDARVRAAQVDGARGEPRHAQQLRVHCSNLRGMRSGEPTEPARPDSAAPPPARWAHAPPGAAAAAGPWRGAGRGA